MIRTNLASILFVVFVVASVHLERTQAAAFASDAQQSEADGDNTEYPPGYVAEGPLPKGFPPPSAVGQIVEKSYPLCRTFSAAGNNAFMSCFSYLAKNKHEMTAPVIMDYKRGAAAAVPPNADLGFMDVLRMHFVLEEPSLDKPQQAGPVTVADLPELRVLSIAVQGPMSPAALAAAEARLEAELAGREDLMVAGPMRVLGYNSPMVPPAKRYWEVQLPIKSK